MTLPFTPVENTKPVKAREAASLVLLRGTVERPEILLGKRRHDLRFMPGYAVFPGGCIDEEDIICASDMLKASPSSESLEGINDGLSTQDWYAHSLAACRECLEESGLLINGGNNSSPYENQHPYFDACRDAQLSNVTLPLPCIAQAITPEASPIRFNARFFYAENAHLDEHAAPEGELHSIAWYDTAQVLESFMLADVTEFVLREALNFFSTKKELKTPPLLTYDMETEAVIIQR